MESVAERLANFHNRLKNQQINELTDSVNTWAVGAVLSLRLIGVCHATTEIGFESFPVRNVADRTPKIHLNQTITPTTLRCLISKNE
jgi:hypothetical protein